jgi:hypothetical protein
MYESLTTNMELTMKEQTKGPKFVFPSPAPSFTGKWAPSFAQTGFSLRVMHFIYNVKNLKIKYLSSYIRRRASLCLV